MSASLPSTQLAQLKTQLRREVQRQRAALDDKDGRSRAVRARLTELPTYRDAAAVLFYVGVRNEVRTRPLLEAALMDGKRVAVPFCVDGRLELVWLQAMTELESGAFGIPEPSASLRSAPERRANVVQLDVILVPGVAFDRSGRRLGHGHGYYDRLLADVRAPTRLVGLAFDCQIVPAVPCGEHDRPVHCVVTESTVHDTGCADGAGEVVQM